MNDKHDNWAEQERDNVDRRRTKHVALGILGLIGAVLAIAYGFWWLAIILIAATAVLGVWSAMT